MRGSKTLKTQKSKTAGFITTTTNIDLKYRHKDKGKIQNKFCWKLKNPFNFVSAGCLK